MPKTDRVPGPTVGKFCPGCGYEWAAVTTPATARLDAPKHLVKHARWEIANGRKPVGWSSAAVAGNLHLIDHLNARICDLQEDLASAQFDLSVANGRGDNYKAELDAIREGRHA